MIIYNLTNHQLVEEQIDALRELYPDANINLDPRGRAFTSYTQRLDWVTLQVGRYETAGGRVAFIIGGDTLAFVMLALALHDAANRYPTKSPAVMLASQVDRDYDNNFKFAFRGWLTWIVKGDR